MPGSPKSYKQGNVKNNFIMSKFFKFKLKPQTLMKITFQSLKYTSAMSSYFFTHKIVTIKPGESMLKLTAIKLEFFFTAKNTMNSVEISHRLEATHNINTKGSVYSEYYPEHLQT